MAAQESRGRGWLPRRLTDSRGQVPGVSRRFRGVAADGSLDPEGRGGQCAFYLARPLLPVETMDVQRKAGCFSRAGRDRSLVGRLRRRAPVLDIPPARRHYPDEDILINVQCRSHWRKAYCIRHEQPVLAQAASAPTEVVSAPAQAAGASAQAASGGVDGITVGLVRLRNGLMPNSTSLSLPCLARLGPGPLFLTVPESSPAPPAPSRCRRACDPPRSGSGSTRRPAAPPGT